MFRSASFEKETPTFGRKLWQIHWLFVLLVCATAAIGIAMLYSAANGSFDPWAKRQVIRFGAGLCLMIGLAVVDVRVWFKHAYLLYFGTLTLLVAVEVMGSIGMGAQRWISIGSATLQPSELMKITLTVALARYFHKCSIEDVGRPHYLVPPLIMVALPAMLVLRQPDLGTAGMLVMAAGAIFFAAGVRLWKFVVVLVAGLAAIPIGWQFLYDYQRMRVIAFLNPETDPLGSGYHIIQSKIALGSGGVFGKGFLQGTQAHLSFLPEKQTDFVFTMLAEEFGMVGGLVLLGLYLLLVAYGFAIALRSRNQFGRLLALGVTTTFFLYVFINTAMVMGLIPVVGVPLPLISYGGTAMMTVLIGFGLLMGVFVHRDTTIGRHGAGDS